MFRSNDISEEIGRGGSKTQRERTRQGRTSLVHTDSQIFLHVVHEVRQHLPRHGKMKHERCSGARTSFNRIALPTGRDAWLFSAPNHALDTMTPAVKMPFCKKPRRDPVGFSHDVGKWVNMPRRRHVVVYQTSCGAAQAKALRNAAECFQKGRAHMACTFKNTLLLIRLLYLPTACPCRVLRTNEGEHAVAGARGRRGVGGGGEKERAGR